MSTTTFRLPRITDSFEVEKSHNRAMHRGQACIKGENARMCRAMLKEEAERDSDLLADLAIVGIVRVCKMIAREKSRN